MTFSFAFRRIFAAAILSLISPACLGAEAKVTVHKVVADLKSKGGGYVIAKYFDCSNGLGYQLIESGAPAGVRLGVLMLEYSDACVTETLQSALGTAMSRAPIVVLPYVNSTPLLAAEKICLPFISVDELPSQRRAVVARARRALSSLHNKKLEMQKLACLAELKSWD